MKRASLILATFLTMIQKAALGRIEALRKAKLIKLCLQCGKPHHHKNSFCSSQCCKSWKNRQEKQHRN